MLSAEEIFGRAKAVIGMVHVRATPGAPFADATPERLAAIAAEEAALLDRLGVDALLIENMHDRPYLRRRVGPEVVAAMTRVGIAVREAAPGRPLGVQILAGANRAALAVAHATGAAFIRVEGFVFASVADEGLMAGADAGRLLRRRRAIGATGVAVLCDIKKKHSAHAITADVSLAETAQAAEFFGADGVVVTGPVTGVAPGDAELRSVRAATTLPVVAGSGVTAENIGAAFASADAVIVGSALKRTGRWDAPIDPDRVRRLIEAADRART